MAAIDSDGRVQLYDILFDLDKATLQPESTKQLQQVVTLLKDHPDSEGRGPGPHRRSGYR